MKGDPVAMRANHNTQLLDRLEVILETLSSMPQDSHTEQDLAASLRAAGHRPVTGAELNALSALGRQLGTV
jgi:hypothetical protein